MSHIAAGAALATVNRAAVFNVNGFKNAGFNAFAAADAGIRNLNPDAFQRCHHLVEMFGRNMLECAHHTATMAAKANA
jgi:hypothetical protein